MSQSDFVIPASCKKERERESVCVCVYILGYIKYLKMSSLILWDMLKADL